MTTTFTATETTTAVFKVIKTP